LADGEIGRIHWYVGAHRNGSAAGRGPLGARRPCLEIARAEFFGSDLLTSFNELCFGRPAYLLATEEPLFVSMALDRDHFVVAVALPPAAKELRVRLSGQSARTLPARLVSREDAARIRLRPFRLIALPLPTDACIEEWATLNRDGSVLWESSADCDSSRAR